MIWEGVAAALLVIGGAFGLIGSFGLIRLRATMQRLHAPTKATTVGVGAVLLASMLLAALRDQRFSWHEVLITLFFLLTAPITANMLAKAHTWRNLRRGDLPPTGVDRDWATFDGDADATPADRRTLPPKTLPRRAPSATLPARREPPC